jgi:Raf kinase inhibitor-like YbhB/YbcL family protein
MLITGIEQRQINNLPPHGRSMKNVVVSLDFLEFPVMYTCDGGNHSPRLTLKGLHAASVAVMVFNPFEKSCCSFTPWIIWNIPSLQVIPEGIPREGIVTAPVPAVQGVTDYGTIGYTGPCPPHGQMIRYQFKVYGLDIMLDLDPGSDKHQLVNSMKGHVIQFGETVAICSR